MKLNNIFQSYETLDINTYFQRCGITDVEEYLNPTGKYNCNPYGFANIKEAVNLFKYHLLGGIDTKIGILVDADVDGFTSASLMYMYIKSYNKKIKVKFYLHNGKERGLDDNKIYRQILDDSLNLLIIPDAGSTYTDKEVELTNNGTDLLVLDHHDSERYIEHGVIINNRLKENIDINPNLSGCGVVYKFLQVMDNELKIKKADKYIDLVGLSVLSDSMPLNDYENRYYVYQLLTMNIHNKFLRELLYQYTNTTKDILTIRDISWSVIPKINSVIRTDDAKMKQKVLGALCGLKNIDCESVAIECSTYHQNQYKYTNEFINTHIDEAKIGKNIILLLSKDIKRSYSGLIAGNISERFNGKPTIVGKSSEKEAIGSFRGVGLDRPTLNNLDGVNWANGHDTGAFGISLDVNKIDELFDNINSLEISYTPVQDVLKTYSINSIPTSLFGVLEPLNGIVGVNMLTTNFGITDIRVRPSDIQVMKKNTLKIQMGKVNIIFFKVNKNKMRENFNIIVDEDGKINYTNNDYINITVIGRLTKNVFRGKTSNQIEVSDYEVTTDFNCFD